MYFSAISVGCAVPQNDFKTTVHSIFESAVNLQLENNGELLTVVAYDQADLPQGIRINAQKTFSFGDICRDEIVMSRTARRG